MQNHCYELAQKCNYCIIIFHTFIIWNQLAALAEVARALQYNRSVYVQVTQRSVRELTTEMFVNESALILKPLRVNSESEQCFRYELDQIKKQSINTFFCR